MTVVPGRVVRDMTLGGARGVVLMVLVVLLQHCSLTSPARLPGWLPLLRARLGDGAPDACCLSATGLANTEIKFNIGSHV